MNSLLLTGASGLIGYKLLSQLSECYSVYSLGRRPVERSKVNHIQHDLTLPALPKNMPERIDAVVHLAQSERFRDFPDGASDVFGVNVNSTFLLLEWARRAGAKRFIYASSGGVYGGGDHGFREDQLIARPEPLGFYLGSKRIGELTVENYNSEFTVVILRFFFVYGLAQKAEMLVPRLVNSVREGRPIRLQGTDGIRMNPVHVSDAAQAVMRSLELETSEKINVAGPEVLSLREIGGIIGRQLNKKPVFEEVDAPKVDLLGDTEKMSRLLCPPAVTFHEGIRELCPPQLANAESGRIP